MKRLLLLGSALIFASQSASAGFIVVSGDMTPTLTASWTTINAPLFKNILGGGTNVLILTSTWGSTSQTNLNGYYNSLSGVTSSLHTGTVTSSDLVGIDLFIAAAPDNPFTSGEAAAISTHINASGSALFMSDAAAISWGPTANSYINGFLSSHGSSMSLVNESLDFGTNTAGSGQIASHTLTAGLTSFRYGWTSSVSGGTTLLRTKSGPRTFIAAEQFAPVPEPSALALLGIGSIALFGYAWRRRSH